MRKPKYNYGLVVNREDRTFAVISTFTMLSSARIAKESFEKGVVWATQRVDTQPSFVRVLNRETIEKWEDMGWIR